MHAWPNEIVDCWKHPHSKPQIIIDWCKTDPFDPFSLFAHVCSPSRGEYFSKQSQQVTGNNSSVSHRVRCTDDDDLQPWRMCRTSACKVWNVVFYDDLFAPSPQEKGVPLIEMSPLLCYCIISTVVQEELRVYMGPNCLLLGCILTCKTLQMCVHEINWNSSQHLFADVDWHKLNKLSSIFFFVSLSNVLLPPHLSSASQIILTQKPEYKILYSLKTPTSSSTEKLTTFV